MSSARYSALYQAPAPGPIVLLAPVSDITTASWLSSLGGSLFAAIDETVADDADYIFSPDNPTTQECEVKFQPVTDPLSSTGHVLTYRLDAIGLDTTYTITLMCGATQIAQWTESVAASATPATYAHTLSGAQADAITDYADLRTRFLAAA